MRGGLDQPGFRGGVVSGCGSWQCEMAVASCPASCLLKTAATRPSPLFTNMYKYHLARHGPVYRSITWVSSAGFFLRPPSHRRSCSFHSHNGPGSPAKGLARLSLPRLFQRPESPTRPSPARRLAHCVPPTSSYTQYPPKFHWIE